MEFYRSDGMLMGILIKEHLVIENDENDDVEEPIEMAKEFRKRLEELKKDDNENDDEQARAELCQAQVHLPKY